MRCDLTIHGTIDWKNLPEKHIIHSSGRRNRITLEYIRDNFPETKANVIISKGDTLENVAVQLAIAGNANIYIPFKYFNVEGIGLWTSFIADTTFGCLHFMDALKYKGEYKFLKHGQLLRGKSTGHTFTFESFDSNGFSIRSAKGRKYKLTYDKLYRFETETIFQPDVVSTILKKITPNYQTQIRNMLGMVSDDYKINLMRII